MCIIYPQYPIQLVLHHPSTDRFSSCFEHFLRVFAGRYKALTGAVHLRRCSLRRTGGFTVHRCGHPVAPQIDQLDVAVDTSYAHHIYQRNPCSHCWPTLHPFPSNLHPRIQIPPLGGDQASGIPKPGPSPVARLVQRTVVRTMVGEPGITRAWI